MSRFGHSVRRVLGAIIGELPGPPAETAAPPDADGRCAGDLDPGRAALDAQLQAKGTIGTGGTVVSAPPVIEPTQR